MRHLHRTAAVTAAVSMLLGTPAAAAQQPDAAQQASDAARQLQSTSSQLEDAREQLDELDTQLAQAQTDEQDARDTADGARDEHADAQDDLREVRQQLSRARQRLAAAERRAEQLTERFDARIRSAYKYGGSRQVEAWMTALQDPDVGEAARTTYRLARIADHDTELRDEAEQVQVERADATRQVAVRQAAAYVVEQDAADARAAAERAEQRAERAAQRARQARDRQEELLAELAADKEAAAAALEEALRILVPHMTVGDLEAAGDTSSWARHLPPAGQQWAPAISDAAARAGIDPRLLAAVVWAESGFNPGALSHAGAVGLSQLMPPTAAGLGVNPYDPHQNLDGGARYLAGLLDSFGGNVDLVLAGYNAGPGAVAKYGGIPPYAETQVYVYRVKTYLQTLASTPAPEPEPEPVPEDVATPGETSVTDTDTDNGAVGIG